MMKNTPFFCLLFFCTIAMAAMIGCGGQSYQYSSDNEIPEGPGVLSGKDGEFTIYGSTSTSRGAVPDASAKTMDQADTVSGEQSIPVVAPTSDQAAAEDFAAFQNCKKERAEFEAFKTWKHSQQGADEYAEFLEWKRCKEFRRWQEKNKIDK
jgi:hypothetical protein